MYRNLMVATCLMTFMLALTPLAFAKEIPLYDQPKDNANEIAKIDLTKGIVPIFTTKEGDWRKIGDPRNGNVGWVKAKELNQQTGVTSFSFTQIQNGKTPQTYQVIQYGQPQQFNEAQMHSMIKKMQVHQQAMQQSMQQSIQHMMKDMDNLFQSHWNFIADAGMPVMMPVIIVPKQTAVSKKSSSTTISSAKTTLPTGKEMSQR